MGEDKMMKGIGLLGITALLAGCASGPSMPPPERVATMQQTETALQELRKEAAALRAELAATRIAAAKQEAELQQVRGQVDELNRALSVKELDFASVRHERDRLLLTRQFQEETGMTQAKLQEVESALTALTTEVAQVKQELAQEPVSVRLNTVRVPDLSPVDEGRPAWVIVHTNESLWLIARR